MLPAFQRALVMGGAGFMRGHLVTALLSLGEESVASLGSGEWSEQDTGCPQRIREQRKRFMLRALRTPVINLRCRRQFSNQGTDFVSYSGGF